MNYEHNTLYFPVIIQPPSLHCVISQHKGRHPARLLLLLSDVYRNTNMAVICSPLWLFTQLAKCVFVSADTFTEAIEQRGHPLSALCWPQTRGVWVWSSSKIQCVRRLLLSSSHPFALHPLISPLSLTSPPHLHPSLTSLLSRPTSGKWWKQDDDPQGLWSW